MGVIANINGFSYQQTIGTFQVQAGRAADLRFVESVARTIAEQLSISSKTVSNHLTLLKSKLQVSSHAELVHLRVRVIALENLVVALLAEGSERQREVAREMAEYISPRPGFTQHPLTLHAAQQMVHSVERAERFQRREDPAG